MYLAPVVYSQTDRVSTVYTDYMYTPPVHRDVNTANKEPYADNQSCVNCLENKIFCECNNPVFEQFTTYNTES